jgi:hypothetical protein
MDLPSSSGKKDKVRSILRIIIIFKVLGLLRLFKKQIMVKVRKKESSNTRPSSKTFREEMSVLILRSQFFDHLENPQRNDLQNSRFQKPLCDFMRQEVSDTYISEHIHH